MRLPFAKMSGAGNDFVLVERTPRGISSPALARRLCDRRRGIGADGLLVVSRVGRRPRLRYFNADGSAAFCGNGSRCAAWWLSQKGWVSGSRFEFETSAGPLSARITGRERAAIRMPAPSAATLGRRLTVRGRRLVGHSVTVGVPHLVVPVPSVERFPVVAAGRALRRHRAFSPEGTNVDFVEFKTGAILLRTYERGVEDETLACGTGAAASAVVGALLGRCRSPVAVATRGGDVLKVSFARTGGSLADLWLEGPARIVYTGEVVL